LIDTANDYVFLAIAPYILDTWSEANSKTVFFFGYSHHTSSSIFIFVLYVLH